MAELQYVQSTIKINNNLIMTMIVMLPQFIFYVQENQVNVLNFGSKRAHSTGKVNMTNKICC